VKTDPTSKSKKLKVRKRIFTVLGKIFLIVDRH